MPKGTVPGKSMLQRMTAPDRLLVQIEGWNYEYRIRDDFDYVLLRHDKTVAGAIACAVDHYKGERTVTNLAKFAREHVEVLEWDPEQPRIKIRIAE